MKQLKPFWYLAGLYIALNAPKTAEVFGSLFAGGQRLGETVYGRSIPVDRNK
jgi:hypothetical protein